MEIRQIMIGPAQDFGYLTKVIHMVVDTDSGSFKPKLPMDRERLAKVLRRVEEKDLSELAVDQYWMKRLGTDMEQVIKACASEGYSLVFHL
jgi:hypothetical protein